MELMSKREAAELLGVSTRGVERAVRRGHLSVVYRQSKHGKKAWFSPAELDRYRQNQRERGPVGFLTPPGGPAVGTLIPAVDMQPRPAIEPARGNSAKVVPIVDRLTLKLAEATQFSELPGKYLLLHLFPSRLSSVMTGSIRVLD